MEKGLDLTIYMKTHFDRVYKTIMGRGLWEASSTYLAKINPSTPLPWNLPGQNSCLPYFAAESYAIYY